MSSQSFALVVEYAMPITGGNFNDVNGIERLVAFLARCPGIKRSDVMHGAMGRLMYLD